MPVYVWRLAADGRRLYESGPYYSTASAETARREAEARYPAATWTVEPAETGSHWTMEKTQ